MADDQEKTEEATPKRIEDARKEGNVRKSAEVPGTAILFFTSVYLLFFAAPLFKYIQNMIYYVYSYIGVSHIDYYYIILTVIKDALINLMPIFFIVSFLAIVFNLVQFGFIIVPLQLKLEKIDPISGFKNVFSGKKFIEALKLALKLIIIFVVMIVVLVLVWDDIIAMMSKDIKSSLDSMMFLTMYFVFAILFIIFIFAIIDFVFVTFYYFKGLKMSKQEIKDEYKNMEGSPEVKQRIRQIQMELSSRQMLQNVPDADVVITNPTHYAVALHYDSKEQNAPKVVAKGVDFLAFKIKEIAREYSIRIIEDPSLARALYEQVDLDREIPQEFYKAVAELLRLVYSENNKE